MEPDESLTRLIEQLQQHDERAAQELFDRYFEQLLHVAAKKLAGTPRQAEDEEDVVVSALKSFIQRAGDGQFPQLKNGDNLWSLLLTITERKALNQRRRQLALKRGAGLVKGESGFGGSFGETQPYQINSVQCPRPTPATIAELREECHRLFELLESPSLRTVARLRLEGFSEAEIAGHLDVVERTVQRKLRVIRECWSRELIS